MGKRACCVQCFYTPLSGGLVSSYYINAKLCNSQPQSKLYLSDCWAVAAAVRTAYIIIQEWYFSMKFALLYQFLFHDELAHHLLLVQLPDEELCFLLADGWREFSGCWGLL